MIRWLMAAVFALVAQGAAAEEPADYKIRDLLSPCVEADNDARWGEAAETECEQYVLGFADALLVTGGAGPDKGICLPGENRADEIRWAYVRWVHENFGRRDEPAGVGLLEALKAKFPCN